MKESLAEIAASSDAAMAKARMKLVAGVREAARAGMTQTEIAAQIGRSQPEVSRLLRFHGTTPLALRLRKASGQIRRLIHDAGGKHVRVFGSVATGTEKADSDVDLLLEMKRPLGLLALGRLEARIAELVDAEVDLVPESTLRHDLRQRVLDEAVPL